MVCFYRVRNICPVKNCYIEYGNNGKCPGDLKYKKDEILNADMPLTSEIEKILKKEAEKLH